VTADVSGERLCCSLPVMSESGAPIYPTESKLVLRNPWKPKVGRMDEHLLAEAFEAISVPLAPSMLLIGVAAKPMSAPARDVVVSAPRDVNKPVRPTTRSIPARLNSTRTRARHCRNPLD
jgi:hypothetical protein